jgi:hypothetical protein
MNEKEYGPIQCLETTTFSPQRVRTEQPTYGNKVTDKPIIQPTNQPNTQTKTNKLNYKSLALHTISISSRKLLSLNDLMPLAIHMFVPMYA